MSLPREGARVTREGILMSVPMNWGLSPDKAVPYRVHTQGQIEGACTAGPCVRRIRRPTSRAR